MAAVAVFKPQSHPSSGSCNDPLMGFELPSRLAVLALLFGAACSSSKSPSHTSAPVDGGHHAPAEASSPGSELETQRHACAFQAGALATDTVDKNYPSATDIPINHVVVIMQENRSFDTYLGRLVAQGYYDSGDFSEGGKGGRGAGFSHSNQLDGPPPGWSNPDGDGGVVVPHPDDEYCYGVNHSWEDMHDDYDDGKLDHFVINNDPNGQRSFFYEDDTVIPFYYSLASTFAVGDRYFASVLGPTWPNRYFMMAATSFGLADNSILGTDTATTPAVQLFSQLEAAGHTWKDYTDGPHQELFFRYFGFRSETTPHLKNAKCDLITDIQNGTLPDVAFVMGDETGQTGDEGPSALPGIGGQWVEGILRALFASSSWKDSAVFFMYDENGGMADHVRPPAACPPDGFAPHDGNGKQLSGAFDTTGFRVPFMVISPYARPHFVSHTVYDHSSVVRFIEDRFGLPAMTARDANAMPPLEMFDFQNPPFVTPPDIKAHTSVDPAVLAQCKQSYSPLGCAP
jgi:phospholipase C